jgi:predicted ATPase
MYDYRIRKQLRTVLTHLHLEHFKNFADATLEMGPLTLVIGTNAAGKSNLRDALRFVHGISRGYTIAEILGEKYGPGGELLWRGIRGGTRETAQDGNSRFALTVGFEVDGDKGSYRIEVDVGGPNVPARVVAERLSVGREYLFDSDAPDDPPRHDPEDKEHLAVRLQRGGGNKRHGQKILCLSQRPALPQLAGNSNIRPAAVRDYALRVVELLGSMRFLDLDPEALRRASLPGQTVLGDKGENLSSVLQEICSRPERRKALADWVSELTPMDAVDFDFPADHAGRVLATLIERDGRRVSAISASDGTLRFLAMIAALLGSQRSDFYFFEELDNGIHPARLHLLLDLVRQHTKSGEVQIVATSHSPELLGLEDEDTLKHASIVYRHGNAGLASVKALIDLPNVRELIHDRQLAHLHSTGWFEQALAFMEADVEKLSKDGGEG